jgi:hypothetical protein
VLSIVKEKGMEKYKLHNFVREKIIDECELIEDLQEQINYLEEVKFYYKTKPPELDVNIRRTPRLEEFLDYKIKLIEGRLKTNQNDKNVSGELGNKKNLQKVKLTDGKGYSDIVRIFEAMKEAEIIDKKTKVPEIAQMFFEENKTFTAKYYSTKSTNKNYSTNSISERLFEFIMIIIKGAYKNRQNKRDELVEFIEKL